MEARTTQQARKAERKKQNADGEALRPDGSGGGGEREAERREEER